MQNRATIRELQIGYHNKANVFKIFVLCKVSKSTIYFDLNIRKNIIFKKDKNGSYSCDKILQISVFLKILIYG